MNSQVVTDMLLTKKAFEEYTKRLREKQAREYGLTLEQWDEAVREGSLVEKINSNNQHTSPTSSYTPQ